MAFLSRSKNSPGSRKVLDEQQQSIHNLTTTVDIHAFPEPSSASSPNGSQKSRGRNHQASFVRQGDSPISRNSSRKSASASETETEDKGNTFQKKFASGTINQGFRGLLDGKHDTVRSGLSLEEKLAAVKDEDIQNIAHLLSNVNDPNKRIGTPPQFLTSTSGSLIQADYSPQSRHIEVSEQTSSRARKAKRYIEARYKHIFSVLEKGDIYNPLQVIRYREEELSKKVEPSITTESGVKDQKRMRERLRTQLINSAQRLPGYQVLTNLVLQGAMDTDLEVDSRNQLHSIWQVHPEEAVRHYLYQKCSEQENIKDFQRQLDKSIPEEEYKSSHDKIQSEMFDSSKKIQLSDSITSLNASNNSVPVAVRDNEENQRPSLIKIKNNQYTPQQSSSSFSTLTVFGRSGSNSPKRSKLSIGGRSRSGSRSRSSSLSSTKGGINDASGGINSGSTALHFPGMQSTAKSQAGHINSGSISSLTSSKDSTELVQEKGRIVHRSSFLQRRKDATDLRDISETPIQEEMDSLKDDRVSNLPIQVPRTPQKHEPLEEEREKLSLEDSTDNIELLESIVSLTMKYEEINLKVAKMHLDLNTNLSEDFKAFAVSDIYKSDLDEDSNTHSIEGRLRQLNAENKFNFDTKVQYMEEELQTSETKVKELQDKVKDIDQVMHERMKEIEDLTGKVVSKYGRQARLAEQEIESLLKAMEHSVLRNVIYVTLNYVLSVLVLLIQIVVIFIRFIIRIINFVVPFWFLRAVYKILNWFISPVVCFTWDIFKYLFYGIFYLVVLPIRAIIKTTKWVIDLNEHSYRYRPTLSTLSSRFDLQDDGDLHWPDMKQGNINDSEFTKGGNTNGLNVDDSLE